MPKTTKILLFILLIIILFAEIVGGAWIKRYFIQKINDSFFVSQISNYLDDNNIVDNNVDILDQQFASAINSIQEDYEDIYIEDIGIEMNSSSYLIEITAYDSLYEYEFLSDTNNGVHLTEMEHRDEEVYYQNTFFELYNNLSKIETVCDNVRRESPNDEITELELEGVNNDLYWNVHTSSDKEYKVDAFNAEVISYSIDD